MKAAPIVLVVSEDAARTRRWEGWLRGAGYVTMRCPGPTQAPCPRLSGMPCGLRQMADAAVVEVGTPAGDVYAQGPQQGCTPLPDDGTTVWVGVASTKDISLEHPVEPGALLAKVGRALGRRARP